MILAEFGTLAAALALSTPPPAAAAASAALPTGVFAGSIGTLPVRVCLDNDGMNRLHGSYYYLGRLRPISLDSYDGPMTEREVGPGGKAGARWALARADRGGLGGEWIDGARHLPILLTPVPGPVSDDGVCASSAFMAPRIRPVTVSAAPAKQNGIAFSRLTYHVGPAFRDVHMESFAMPETLPGDRAINAAMRLAPARSGSLGDYLGCMSGSLTSNGIDGDYNVTMTPALMRAGYLSVAIALENDCGGAHPNADSYNRSFDRRSGREIDLAGWLNPRGSPPRAKGEGEGFSPNDPEAQLTPELIRQVLAGHRIADAECRDAMAGQDYWYLAVSAGGIAFTPALPHVAQACAETYVVSFARLAPFLSAAGKAGAARLMAGGR